MPAGIYNMKVEQGVTFSQNMTWKIDSNVVNLSGYTARMNVRTSRSGRVPANILILALTSGDGITLGGAAGTIRIDLSATQTSNISAGTYAYDLELESAGEEVTRLLSGTFTVSPEVTY
jgi:hypothetical protein